MLGKKKKKVSHTEFSEVQKTIKFAKFIQKEKMSKSQVET